MIGKSRERTPWRRGLLVRLAGWRGAMMLARGGSKYYVPTTLPARSLHQVFAAPDGSSPGIEPMENLRTVLARQGRPGACGRQTLPGVRQQRYPISSGQAPGPMRGVVASQYRSR